MKETMQSILEKLAKSNDDKNRVLEDMAEALVNLNTRISNAMSYIKTNETRLSALEIAVQHIEKENEVVEENSPMKKWNPNDDWKFEVKRMSNGYVITHSETFGYAPVEAVVEITDNEHSLKAEKEAMAAVIYHLMETFAQGFNKHNDYNIKIKVEKNLEKND